MRRLLHACNKSQHISMYYNIQIIKQNTLPLSSFYLPIHTKMDSQLTCALCQNQYSDTNPPRLLITCGHTFCQSCVKKIITENKTATQKKVSYKLVCPEDGSMITLEKNDMTNFPINIALIKILQAKKNTLDFKDPYLEMSKIVKTQQQQEDDDTRDLVASIISPNNTKSEDAIKLQNKQQDDKQQPVQQCKPTLTPVSSPQKQKQKKQQKEMCLLHQKPLQVVCVMDLKKICASCAIFGQHKGHDFKSIDEIEKERVDYYHSILNVMDKKQTIVERLSNQQTCSSIMELLGKKKQTMRKNIQQKYQKLLFTIEAKQKQSMKNLDSILLKTQSKLKNLMKIDPNIMQKYDQWQEKSYREIKILEGDDFERKLHLLFVGPTSNEADVIEQGEIIIQQMNKQEQNLVNEVQLALENIGVDFNMEIFNHIDGFMELYDETKKKKTKSRLNKSENQPPSVQSIPPTSKVNVPSVKKQQQLPLPQIKVIEEKPKIEVPMTRIVQQKIVHSHHEESLLEMIDEPEIKKQQFEQLPKKEMVISMSIKNSPEKVEFLTDLNLGSTAQKKVQKNEKPSNQGTKVEETLVKHRSPQLTQRSNKKDSSFMLEKASDKPNKKKLLAKIKVSQKYSKVLDGLANDQLQTVDFTNAQLGDASTVQICQFLNGSKAKTVKLISNKLTDDCIQKILPYMGNIITLNLSQNFLTQRSLDIILNGKDHLMSIKSIILCQNKIIERKHKGKIDKLKQLGFTVSV